MNRLTPIITLMPLFLFGCGMSPEDKANVAAVTCSVMGETRNMDSAIRVREINAAREKIGEAPFLGGDSKIKESFEWGLCGELVLNDPTYNAKVSEQQALRREAKRQLAAKERRERERIEAEERRKIMEKELAERETHKTKITDFKLAKGTHTLRCGVYIYSIDFDKKLYSDSKVDEKDINPAFNPLSVKPTRPMYRLRVLDSSVSWLWSNNPNEIMGITTEYVYKFRSGEYAHLTELKRQSATLLLAGKYRSEEERDNIDVVDCRIIG